MLWVMLLLSSAVVVSGCHTSSNPPREVLPLPTSTTQLALQEISQLLDSYNRSYEQALASGDTSPLQQYFESYGSLWTAQHDRIVKNRLSPEPYRVQYRGMRVLEFRLESNRDAVVVCDEVWDVWQMSGEQEIGRENGLITQVVYVLRRTEDSSWRIYAADARTLRR